MKKIVHNLSPLIAFLFTAAVMTLISFYLISFLQQILEATPDQSLMRGF